jgi:Acyclic terpene utilisation family protein AtuA
MSFPPGGASSIRIGVGTGTADDRIHPAVQLALHGDLDYLVFECLAERTVARENLARSKEPERGYTPRLLERIEAVLPLCLEKDIRIVTNMGAANPRAGARAVRRLGRELGVGDVSCAIVAGDDVSDLVRKMPELRLLETGAPLGIHSVSHGVCQRLSWSRRGSTGVGDRCQDRDHRTRLRSVAVPCPRSARICLELR